jgi:hypothetical protein
MTIKKTYTSTFLLLSVFLYPFFLILPGIVFVVFFENVLPRSVIVACCVLASPTFFAYRYWKNRRMERVLLKRWGLESIKFRNVARKETAHFYSCLIAQLDTREKYFTPLGESGTHAVALKMYPTVTVADFHWTNELATKSSHICDSTTRYSSVASVDLIKSVPHIFLDGKANKRKWYHLFSPSQKYSFEGDFGSFFTTYIPGKHEVNSLAFLSPEVLDAFKQYSKYDFEIVGNKLFAYTHLDARPEVVKELCKALAELGEQLNDNLKHYTLDAVYKDGAQQSHALKKHPIWFVLLYLLSAGMLLASILGFKAAFDTRDGRETSEDISLAVRGFLAAMILAGLAYATKKEDRWGKK